MRSEHANIMDRRRSINQNAHVRLNNTIWLDGQLQKYLDKNSSVLTPEADSHASHLISLLSLCTKLTLTPPISFLCSALSVVSLSALSSVESSSSSSSFFRLLQRALILFFFFFFKFYFCLIWYEKYILKVEIWSTKHQATLICWLHCHQRRKRAKLGCGFGQKHRPKCSFAQQRRFLF